MAELNPPFVLQNRADHDAASFRQMVESLVSSAGVVDKPGGALAVTELSTPAMAVEIAAGAVWIDGDEASTQGFYHARNDAALQKTVAAADATNPRKDLVVARLRDDFYSGTEQKWEVEVIPGTAAASPAEPSVPTNSVVLALVDVPAGASAITNANITDRRPEAGYRAGGLRQVVTFTSSGTFDKADYPWARKVRPRVQGASGAGGGAVATAAGEASAGSGGGGGGYAESLLDVSALAASETVTVGAKGTGVAGGNGGSGGGSSFGTHVTTTGGAGGTATTAGAGAISAGGGFGGSGTGDISISGGRGGAGARNGGVGWGGRGGDGQLGGSGNGASVNGGGDNAIGYGAGGGGAANLPSQTAKAGGDGSDGVVIVELYG